MSLSLARNNVTYAVRLRSPNGKRVGFYNSLWDGQLHRGLFVTEAQWSGMPPSAALFEKVTDAYQFRQLLLDNHLNEITCSQKYLSEQKAELAALSPEDTDRDGLIDYLAETEKKLNDAIEMVPYIRNAEIVRIVVETV